MMSKEFPKILISNILGLQILGFITLAQRILTIPISLLAASTQTVFFKYASEEYKKNGNALKIYDRTLKKMLLISILPFTLLMLTAPLLFVIVFGENWRASGEIVQILVPFYFFYFIGAPLNVMFAIAEKHKSEFLWQTMFLILSVSSVVISSLFTDSYKVILMCFSVSNALVFIIGILMTRYIAKGK